MTSAENPYAPPQTEAGMMNAEVVPGGGLWRDGNILVMYKNANLPARCVKSNVPATRRLKRSLYWHHPAIYLSILISILIYVVLALVLRKTATIHIALSDEWFAKRRSSMLVGWIAVLLSIGMFVVGVSGIDSGGAQVWLFALSPLVFLFGAIYGLLKSRMVAPKRIDDTFVYLKGVHPDFLAELPEWQPAQ